MTLMRSSYLRLQQLFVTQRIHSQDKFIFIPGSHTCTKNLIVFVSSWVYSYPKVIRPEKLEIKRRSINVGSSIEQN